MDEQRVSEEREKAEEESRPRLAGLAFFANPARAAEIEAEAKLEFEKRKKPDEDKPGS